MTTGESFGPGSGKAAPAAPPRLAVAVIVPAYNEQGAVRLTVEKVHRALDGVSMSHEIIVVNDGSTDNTLQVLARYTQIRVVSQTNAGPAAATDRSSNLVTGPTDRAEGASNYMPATARRIASRARCSKVCVRKRRQSKRPMGSSAI